MSQPNFTEKTPEIQQANNGALALNYAALGWYIFPCKSDKSPYTKHGKDDATVYKPAIRAWWQRWPDALIGIYCEKSGFFALDVDNKNGKNGSRALAELVETAGGGQPIEAGPMQETPSGGLHLLFRLPEGLAIPNNSDKLGPGLDLRSNGYICTGGPYRWRPGHPPSAALPDAPAWLLDAIRNLSEKPASNGHQAAETVSTHDARGAGEYWLDYFLARAGGNRNDSGFDLACQLRDSGLTKSEAESYMRAFVARAPAGDHPYTEREALASLAQAYKGAKRPGAYIPGVTTRMIEELYQEPEPPPNFTDELQAPAPPVATVDQAPANGDLTERERKEQLNQALLGESADHEGHARCVVLMHGARFAYSEAYGWLYYTGKFWNQEGAEQRVDRAIVKTLKARRVAAVHAENEPLVKVTRANSSNVSGTKALLQSLVFVKVGDFDQNPDLLNCANGVLNLRTGELQAHDPQQRFTYCLPVDYDPGADFTTWVDFLNGATGDPEITDYLRRAVGYSLTGYTWEEVLFYVYGPTRSGKGTFTETLLRVLGNEPLATEADFTTFTADRYGDTQNFDLAPLKPCRFVAASESNKHQPLNPAKIKALTGGNLVRCAFKHRDHFTYRPQFKIWLSSNHPVNVDVDDSAAWARVRVIIFPTSYLGREDKTLKHRMTGPANLRGVLRWAVEGAREWYALKNGLPLPEKIRKETETQRESQDYVQQFLDDETEPNPSAWVHTGALWDLYKKWCEANGVPAKYQRQFSQAIEAKGYKRGRPYNAEKKQVRAFMGLKVGQE